MGKWIDANEVEERTGLTKNFWARRRMKGLPPEYVKLNRAVRYDEDAVDRFMQAHRRTSTSDPGRVPDPTPLRPRLARRDPDRRGPGRPRRKIEPVEA